MQVPVDELNDRPAEDIQYIVIHHSVTAQSLDIAEVAEMEKASQGFVTIGYNCVVRKGDDGWQIQEGRPLNKLPAAQYGLNQQGYAICVFGNYEPNVAGISTNMVDPASLDLVVERIEAVKAKCPNLKYLIGHRDVATIKAKHGGNPGDFSTACPGELLYAKMHDLRVRTGLHSPPEIL